MISFSQYAAAIMMIVIHLAEKFNEDLKSISSYKLQILSTISLSLKRQD